MTIEKNRFDGSLRKVRGLYRSHTENALSPSSFIAKARAELHSLYLQHTKELVDQTASRFIRELRTYESQFGLDLSCGEVHLTNKTRGYRGLRASMSITNRAFVFFNGHVEVFIGPFDEWNKVAIHTVEERESWNEPSLYTKRKAKRWQNVEDFDFPALLQRIKEAIGKPEPDYEDEIPF